MTTTTTKERRGIIPRLVVIENDGAISVNHGLNRVSFGDTARRRLGLLLARVADKIKRLSTVSLLVRRMHGRFDTQKTIQAIGVLLLNEHSRTASKLRVLKLLYIADRESIKETGRPILGSRVVAMDHGPLHSEVLNLINGQHIDEPAFSAHFEKHGYQIELIHDPGVGRLSRQEIGKLQEVSESFASTGDWELAHDVTHAFEEWKRNYRQGTSTTIALEDIIDAVGRTADKEAIVQDAKDEAEFDELFESPSL